MTPHEIKQLEEDEKFRNNRIHVRYALMDAFEKRQKQIFEHVQLTEIASVWGWHLNAKLGTPIQEAKLVALDNLIEAICDGKLSQGWLLDYRNLPVEHVFTRQQAEEARLVYHRKDESFPSLDELQFFPKDRELDVVLTSEGMRAFQTQRFHGMAPDEIKFFTRQFEIVWIPRGVAVEFLVSAGIPADRFLTLWGGSTPSAPGTQPAPTKQVGKIKRPPKGYVPWPNVEDLPEALSEKPAWARTVLLKLYPERPTGPGYSLKNIAERATEFVKKNPILAPRKTTDGRGSENIASVVTYDDVRRVSGKRKVSPK